MTENRTFYGEYSLQHWIRLILTRNVTLPDYQRYFVWDEKKTTSLIDALKIKQFIPPVTIGAYNSTIDSPKRSNLILDGQQRLTSILLAYIGAFPTRENSRHLAEVGLADENDIRYDDDEDDYTYLEWNFNRLLGHGLDSKSISEKLDWKNYKHLGLELDRNFFKENYLGFSYLVPGGTTTQEQQKFYSTVFRSINVQGIPLMAQESRAALYFLKAGLEDYLNPEFSSKIQVQSSRIDFARILALMSQYSKEKDPNTLARGNARTMENYYVDFVHANVNDDPSGKFELLSSVRDLSIRFDRLETTLVRLGISRPRGVTSYDSVIDTDVRLFGLVNSIIFEGNEIPPTADTWLSDSWRDAISRFKDNSLHARNPGRLKYLRERAAESIKIYESVAQ